MCFCALGFVSEYIAVVSLVFLVDLEPFLSLCFCVISAAAESAFPVPHFHVKVIHVLTCDWLDLKPAGGSAEA